MKIAYLASIKSRHDGVSRKIQIQMHEWKRLGHDVRSFFMTRSPHPVFFTYRLWSRFNLFNPCFSIVYSLWKYKPDVIYMREDNLIILRIFLLLLFKNIVIEINSYDKEENKILKTSTIKKISFNIINYINKISYKNALGLIFVTYELRNFAEYSNCKHSAIIPNTRSDTKSIKKRSTSYNKRINLFFLGSPNQPWHGIDKMISIAKKLDEKIELHLIGPSPQDIKQFSPSKNITAYGFLSDYKKIIAKCHIAICTLALYRKKMNEACPLKTREYLESGFPIIIGYKDTSFLHNNYDFILQLENSENSINDNSIKRIYDFCLRQYNHIVSSEEIISLLPPPLKN